MLIAVEETAADNGRTRQGETTAASRLPSGARTILRCALRHCAFAVLLLLVVIPAFLPLASEAQVVAAPGSGAKVIQTQNGPPQVTIAKPSYSGVSLNTYSQFDVQKPSAILNISPVIVQTQQAGYINGNPKFLPGQSAKIIVNQVNSNSPSQLNGYVEVAGSRRSRNANP
jgi:filamentous hemagglutinin